MMAAGLPLVAQPRGCLPELVATGRTGYLARTEEEVAGALRRLVEDGGLRERFAVAARARARRYGRASFARRWRALVRLLLDG